MNGEILRNIFQISIIIFAAVGGLFCIYIFGGFIFKIKSNLHMKGNAYLILDADEIGEMLEYYVRKIESDIAGRYIYISKIILYSNRLNAPGQKAQPDEIFKICRILAGNYNNIIFLNDAIIEKESDIISLNLLLKEILFCPRTEKEKKI